MTIIRRFKSLQSYIPLAVEFILTADKYIGVFLLGYIIGKGVI